MADIHEYPVVVRWLGGREGSGASTSVRSSTVNPLSVPEESGGPGTGTNPEELLTSAIASCYSITFGIVADNQKIPVADFECTAVGEVEKAGASFTYKKITIKPVITLSHTADETVVAKANDMAHRADSYCLITNAVRGKVEIVVEPTIQRA